MGGTAVVDHTPDDIREWALPRFGRSDKSVLFATPGGDRRRESAGPPVART
ncbi:hypothetical protein [Skermania piniformis]|uniref:Uncharacterized protein n=1 Tax=Skermania pinensis TaxID=39122 RepID=A0ABX8SCI6_9ACTN|nr:hypothetical protein [Skermania piniformis]QXQ14672.1 hypothetical protein KV203_04520 [Skermania piniformis]